MILSEQDKKILVMRANNESLNDIAKNFNISIGDAKNVFEKVASQTKTVDDTLELQKILKTFPYTMTEAKSIKILDGIQKDHLIQYMVNTFPDEMGSALRDAYA